MTFDIDIVVFVSCTACLNGNKMIPFLSDIGAIYTSITPKLSQRALFFMVGVTYAAKKEATFLSFSPIMIIRSIMIILKLRRFKNVAI